MSDDTKMIPGGIGFGPTATGFNSWETGRPWFTVTPNDTLAAEMQRLERENAELKSLLGAKNQRLEEVEEQLALLAAAERTRQAAAR